MPLLDHLFVITFVVIYPIAGYFSFRGLVRRSATGLPVNRVQLYRSTMIGHWLLLLVGLLIWNYDARPWSSLGLDWSIDRGFLLALALTLVSFIVLAIQLHQVKKVKPRKLARFKAQFGDLILMMPHNGNELMRFNLLSVTAGIVEEILWRGFLIWYLNQAMDLWAAALLSALCFGLAHSYQGLAQLPKISLVGAALAGLYVLSGSLWLPILLHSAIDIVQGQLACDVVNRSDDSANNLAGNVQPAP